MRAHNIAALGAAAAAAAALVARALSRRTVVRHLVHIALKPNAPLKDILTEGDKMAAAMPHLIICLLYTSPSPRD